MSLAQGLVQAGCGLPRRADRPTAIDRELKAALFPKAVIASQPDCSPSEKYSWKACAPPDHML